jgi:hypothetical protein
MSHGGNPKDLWQEVPGWNLGWAQPVLNETARDVSPSMRTQGERH